MRDLGVWITTAVLALAIGALSGFGFTYNWANQRYTNLQKELATRQTITEVVEKVVIQEVEKEKIVYRDRIQKIPIETIVEREVYKNVCLDGEGVDAINTYFGN